MCPAKTRTAVFTRRHNACSVRIVGWLGGGVQPPNSFNNPLSSAEENMIKGGSVITHPARNAVSHFKVFVDEMYKVYSMSPKNQRELLYEAETPSVQLLDERQRGQSR